MWRNKGIGVLGMVWLHRTRIWLDCGAFTFHVPYYLCQQWLLLRGPAEVQHTSHCRCSLACVQWTAAFVELPAQSCPSHPSQQHWHCPAAQLAACGGQGLHGMPKVNSSHSQNTGVTQEPRPTLHLSFIDGSASRLPPEHSCVSGGDLVGDLTKIPISSGPVEFDIKLLPCKPAPAYSGLSSRSTMQVVHIHVLLVFHTPSSPHIPSYKQQNALPAVRVLRRIFFIHISGFKASRWHRPQRWWWLSVRGDCPNICLIFTERDMAHPSFWLCSPFTLPAPVQRNT